MTAIASSPAENISPSGEKFGALRRDDHRSSQSLLSTCMFCSSVAVLVEVSLGDVSLCDIVIIFHIIKSGILLIKQVYNRCKILICFFMWCHIFLLPCEFHNLL